MATRLPRPYLDATAPLPPFPSPPLPPRHQVLPPSLPLGPPLPAVRQADPTLRVHIAGTGRALGVPHVDADYFHQVRSRDRYLLPTTYYLHLLPASLLLTTYLPAGGVELLAAAHRVLGANTLWCETRRGAADYTFEMAGPGTYQRFWGNQLRPSPSPTTRARRASPSICAACPSPSSSMTGRRPRATCPSPSASTTGGRGRRRTRAEAATAARPPRAPRPRGGAAGGGAGGGGGRQRGRRRGRRRAAARAAAGAAARAAAGRRGVAARVARLTRALRLACRRGGGQSSGQSGQAEESDGGGSDDDGSAGSSGLMPVLGNGGAGGEGCLIKEVGA